MTGISIEVIIWIVIGFVVTLMMGRYMKGRRTFWTDALTAVGGSLVGGFSSYAAIGSGTPQTFIIAILVACFVSAGVLWLLDTVWLKLGGPRH